jgi:hypothetical protein
MTMKLALLAGAIVAMAVGVFAFTRTRRSSTPSHDELAVRPVTADSRGDVGSEDRGGVWADDGGAIAAPAASVAR